MDATWFVDPPYERAGKYYRFKLNNYGHLAEWCRNRRGQVIVCENDGATWLPFKPFAMTRSTPGVHRKSYSAEVLWTNERDEPSLFDLMVNLKD